MPLKLPPEKWAGITYLAPAVAVGGIWSILLFVAADTPGSGPGAMLKFALFETPERLTFWWLGALPFVCVLLAILYFSPLAHERRGAIILCSAGILVALVSWFMLDVTIGIFVTLPLWFSAPRAKWHLTMRSSGP